MTGTTTRYEEDLRQLARLTLDGSLEDAKLFLARLSRKYRSRNPELSEQLATFLKDARSVSPEPESLSPARLSKGHLPEVELGFSIDSFVKYSGPQKIQKPLLEPEVEKSIDTIILERKHQNELVRHGLKPVSTAVFTGPPGVGKTITAQWLANVLGLPMVTLDLASVMSSKLGQSGANLRAVLDYARMNPCLLFLDEIDAIAKSRSDESDIGELKRLVTILLQELNTWTGESLLVAATNHPELIDPALWRRFDTKVDFPLPGIDAIERAILAFSGVDADKISPFARLLASLSRGESLSNIEKDVASIRKNSILRSQSVEESIQAMVHARSHKLSLNEKKKLALKMFREFGMTQAKSASLVGISRDTLRKIVAESKES